MDFRPAAWKSPLGMRKIRLPFRRASAMSEAERQAKVSVVIPCFNEETVLPHLYWDLQVCLDRLGRKYLLEVLLIDDGSRDATWNLIREFSAKDRRIRGLALSRNFGHQSALSCGYDRSTGDAIIALDADLQDPPELIEDLLQKWEQGADVVYAVRECREGESLFKRSTAALFYRIAGALGVRHLRADSGDFRLMSRRSLEALKSLPECHRFLRGMVGWIGFRTAEVRYVRKPRRTGTTKYSISKMVRFAMDGVLSFSMLPLRLPYLGAGLLGLGMFGYLLTALVRRLFFGEPLFTAWFVSICAFGAFGTMNLLCLGILGEYVGRIHEQSKNRPQYIVLEASDQGTPLRPPPPRPPKAEIPDPTPGVVESAPK